MKVLIDEQAPIQFAATLRFVLHAHEVRHLNDLSWKGKKDVALLMDAARHGFDVIITNDADQLNDPEETKAIRRPRLHHVRYRVPRGPHGQARALGGLTAAMPLVMRGLEQASGQRLVEIRVPSGKLDERCRIVDPQRDPPAYWR